MARPGIFREHDPAVKQLFEICGWFLGWDIPEFDVGLPVGDPGRRPEDHRHLELFRKLKGIGDHVLGFLGGGRVKTGHKGKLGVAPRILLVLGGVAGGVIAHNNDQPALCPGVGKGHEGVGCHVQPHVLHGNHRAHSGPGGPDYHFHCHLFIHGPFDIVVPLLPGRKGIDDLRRRSPRITSSHLHAAF